jgi:DNA-binding beta-propeller fold protein YncE
VAGTVTRIDPSANRVVATIRTGGRPVHVAADERSVWVAYPLDTLVRRIDPLTNTVAGTVRVAQPQGVAIGFGSVWVPSQRAREVLRFNPRADRTTARAAGRIPLAGEPAFIAVGRTAVWVGGHDRTVQRIDPATGTVTASRPVAGRSTPWRSTRSRCGPPARSATPSRGPGFPGRHHGQEGT